MRPQLIPATVLPPAAKAGRKSQLGLIPGAVAVLSMLCMTVACGQRSTHPSDASGGAPVSTSAEAGSAPAAAAAAAAAPVAAAAHPILGQWTLLDTDEAAYCQSQQAFTPDSSTSVKDGKTSTGHPIYNVQAKFVDVSYGGPNFEQWDVNGPDDLTLELISPYSVTSCRYHRA
jgi:hypothetical protein